METFATIFLFMFGFLGLMLWLSNTKYRDLAGVLFGLAFMSLWLSILVGVPVALWKYILGG